MEKPKKIQKWYPRGNPLMQFRCSAIEKKGIEDFCVKKGITPESLFRGVIFILLNPRKFEAEQKLKELRIKKETTLELMDEFHRMIGKSQLRET